MKKKIDLSNRTKEITSICIFKCVLKSDNNVKNNDKDNSNTCGIDDTPFLDRATQRYCLIALINISLVLKTSPAFCRHARSNSRDKTLDLNSCDLKKMWIKRLAALY